MKKILAVMLMLFGGLILSGCAQIIASMGVAQDGSIVLSMRIDVAGARPTVAQIATIQGLIDDFADLSPEQEIRTIIGEDGREKDFIYRAAMQIRNPSQHFILDFLFSNIESFYYFLGVRDLREVATTVSDPRETMFFREFDLVFANPLRVFMQNIANEALISQTEIRFDGNRNDLTYIYLWGTTQRRSHVYSYSTTRVTGGWEHMFVAQGVQQLEDIRVRELRANPTMWYVVGIGISVVAMVAIYFWHKNKTPVAKEDVPFIMN